MGRRNDADISTAYNYLVYLCEYTTILILIFRSVRWDFECDRTLCEGHDSSPSPPTRRPVMARSFRSPLLSLATLVLFAWSTSAIHFYMDLKDRRCFIEELPTDTVVEGKCTPHSQNASR